MPFFGARCVKPSQHRDFDPNIPFGACSVWHRGIGVSEPHPYIICPIRFVQDHRIFLDASRLLSPREGTEIIIVPEISLPMGRIDYILSLYDVAKQEVVDFIALEAMACSTTTTGDVLRSFHDLLQGQTTEEKLKYGINFRQVISRMTVQVLAKAYACEKWNKRMIWAIQDVLYRYMQATTRVELTKIPLATLENLPADIPVLFFTYGFFTYGMEMNTEQQRFELRLREAYGGTKESFARILEPTELPETSRMLELIQHRIQAKESIFALHILLSQGLAKVASKIIRESPTEYNSHA
jgi:hypothetical protein